MQAAVPELIDLAGETARREQLYGLDATYEPDRDLRPPVPARPPAGRARRAVRRADLPDGRHRPLGPARRPEGRTREQRPGRRSADRRAPDRPEAARACSNRRWSSGPASSAARRSRRGATAATTTRSASASGWPAAASRAGPSTARPTNTATRSSRTRSRSTTCTPRCCTCWARSQAPDLPLRRPRHAADRRPRRGRQGDPGVVLVGWI